MVVGVTDEVKGVGWDASQVDGPQDGRMTRPDYLRSCRLHSLTLISVFQITRQNGSPSSSLLSLLQEQALSQISIQSWCS